MTTGFYLFLNIGTSEMMLIMFAILFLFGGKKLPELARGFGRGIREFKDASDTIKRDINDQINNFESDIDKVKSDVKSIGQSMTEDEVTPTEVSLAQEPSPVNMDHQNDIDHSDQYYKNYDYNYPEESVASTEEAIEKPADADQVDDSIIDEKGSTAS